MIDTVQTVLVMLVTLGLLVAVHEFGHFYVARRCGVKVLRFSIGFGKPLLSWRDKQGTEYTLAAIPLGGYVKMLDEREAAVPTELQAQAFNAQSVQKRMAIAVAGPVANFVLAITVYWLIFMSGVTGVAPVIGSVEAGSIADRAGLQDGREITQVDGKDTATWQMVNLALMQRLGESGDLHLVSRELGADLQIESTLVLNDWLVGETEPDLLRGLGITPYRPVFLPIVAQVQEDSPAQQAGLLAGDRIIRADDEIMNDWMAWVNYVRARPDQWIDLVYQRDGLSLTTRIKPRAHLAEDGVTIGQVGLGVQSPRWPDEMIRQSQYSVLEAFPAALGRTWEISVFTIDSLKKMLVGLISPKNLSGPITIAKVAGASARGGLESYLSFVALLSISLGVLNLLPIPVLDGGHLLFYSIEWLKGSPVPERIQSLGYQVGMALVVGLMVLAFVNDISRL